MVVRNNSFIDSKLDSLVTILKQTRQQALRAYCPNLYTLSKGCFMLSMSGFITMLVIGKIKLCV